MCDEAKDCGCRIAVSRVYRELREHNIPEISAFDTAAKIFRLHHPEVPVRESLFTISEWLSDEAGDGLDGDPSPRRPITLD